MTFQELELVEPVLRALDQKGYVQPTPIQEQAIPALLTGQDLLGCAQTGTGKTAAFAIPIIQRLYQQRSSDKGPRTPRALVLVPTRELAVQVSESFRAYGEFTGLRHTVIYGGVSQRPQTEALRKGVDVIVATPGRLLDLINQRFVHLKAIQYLVLDEADHMLDLGFIHDIQRIIGMLPSPRQNLFFSATMPPPIQQLADSLLNDPVRVQVAPVASTTDLVEQALYHVARDHKHALLVSLLEDEKVDTALVFTRTKHGADRVAKELNKAGINTQAIHGNKSQQARQSALNSFKARRTRVLVATDIAARGIDVDELALVVNYDLPNVPETYVHRIGRTGRAGNNGVAVSFCDAEERRDLRDIQRLIGKDIPVVEGHPWALKVPLPPAKPSFAQGGGRFGVRKPAKRRR